MSVLPGRWCAGGARCGTSADGACWLSGENACDVCCSGAARGTALRKHGGDDSVVVVVVVVVVEVLVVFVAVVVAVVVVVALAGGRGMRMRRR